jgi:hypothetical protein
VGGDEMQRGKDQHWKAQGFVTFWPLLASTLLYLATSYGFWRDGNGPLAFAFLGYALANCGFLALCAK